MLKLLAFLAASYGALKALKPYAWVLLVLLACACYMAGVYLPSTHGRAVAGLSLAVACIALGGIAENRLQ